MKTVRRPSLITFAAWIAAAALASAQTGTPPVTPAAPKPATAATPGASTPGDYVIGAEDVLTVFFWREKDMSGDVVVRPDGRITLPLINDVMAAGLTPDQLRETVMVEAKKYMTDPSATVIVKQINSRKVFITGSVKNPGPYPIISPMTVLQLISTAGGLTDFAKRKDIVIMRTQGATQMSYAFDYDAVSKRMRLQQNILLKPGDTVVVP